MNNFFSKLQNELIKQEWKILFAATVLVFIGFVGGRALISIGIISIILLGILKKKSSTDFRAFFQQPIFSLLSIFFFLVLFSYFNSDNKTIWWQWIILKLPFLFLPFSFYFLSQLDKRKTALLLFTFAFICSLSAVKVLCNYLLHYDAITKSISSGSKIPMPYSHIRYNLLLVFSFFSLLWLQENNWVYKWKSEKYLQLFLLTFLFIVIHVFSVRSGWAALYIGLLIYFFRLIFLKKTLLGGLILLILLCTLPIVAYKTIPSFKNRVEYMRYDLSQYKEGKVDNLNDGIRLATWKVGLVTIRENFWFGTGVGDLQQVTKINFQKVFPQITQEETRKMPHNQFLWIDAAYGLVGLLFFLVAFFVPATIAIKKSGWLAFVFYSILFTSFLAEYTLEEQIGSVFYLIFTLIFFKSE